VHNIMPCSCTLLCSERDAHLLPDRSDAVCSCSSMQLVSLRRPPESDRPLLSWRAGGDRGNSATGGKPPGCSRGLANGLSGGVKSPVSRSLLSSPLQ
jgi:hypothetical protein